MEALGAPVAGAWARLGCVVRVESVREVTAAATAGGGTRAPQVERRLDISSLHGVEAARMGHLVRGHWSVENNLHWQLDVSFREDERRTRAGHSAEDYSRACRLALEPAQAGPER